MSRKATTSIGIDVLVRSEQTSGHASIVEMTAGPDFDGPPLHVHDFDEAFYVLEGELTFRVEDELLTRQAGELAFAPRGVPHTLANRSGAPARYLLISTPAGFERSLARRAAERKGAEPPAWARQPTPEVAFVGPRIGEEP